MIFQYEAIQWTLGFGLLFAILGYRLRDRAETWVK